MKRDKGGDGQDHHDHEKIVPATIATRRFAAETYVAELKANGIQATVFSDDAGGWRAGGQVEGYRIMVFENDVPAAREILAGLPDFAEE